MNQDKVEQLTRNLQDATAYLKKCSDQQSVLYLETQSIKECLKRLEACTIEAPSLYGAIKATKQVLSECREEYRVMADRAETAKQEITRITNEIKYLNSEKPASFGAFG